MVKILLIIGICGNALAALPPDAQKMLDSLPGKTLSLDLVVSRAVQASDSFQSVASQKVNIPTAGLQARASLDTILKLEGRFLDDNNEPTNNFQPNRTKNTSLSLGVVTRFSTGTSLSAELSHGHTELGFAPIPGFGDPSSQFFRSNAKVALKQSLWKDAFGTATRNQVEAGEHQTRYAESAFEESVEQWVLQLMELYYQAWFSKARVKASQDGVDRQKKLVRITGIKRKRGTAERPDVIQVQSNFAQTQIDAANAHEALKAIWRDLVLSLKLPETWVHLDPMQIPISLPSIVDATLEACKKEGGPDSSTSVKKAEALAQAAKAAETSASSQSKPDLTFGVELNSNGIDGSGGTSASEAAAIDHPAWGATLTLTVPLGFRAEEAQYRAAKADSLRADALASDAKSRLRVSWLNECASLQRQAANTKILESTYDSQVQRTKLEQRRFSVGRSQVLQFIQADSDATATELALRAAQRDLHLNAWRVKRLNGTLKVYFDQLIKNPPKMGAFGMPGPAFARGISTKDRS